MEAQNTSSKVLKTVNNNDLDVVAWWCDDKFTREEVNDGAPMQLRFTERDDGLDGTCTMERVTDGEVKTTERVGQPEIEKYLGDGRRSWWTESR